MDNPSTATPLMAYDIYEAARQVSVSDDTLRAAIKEGKLVARLVGRKYIIVREDLRAWLNGLPTSEGVA